MKSIFGRSVFFYYSSILALTLLGLFGLYNLQDENANAYKRKSLNSVFNHIQEDMETLRNSGNLTLPRGADSKENLEQAILKIDKIDRNTKRLDVLFHLKNEYSALESAIQDSKLSLTTLKSSNDPVRSFRALGDMAASFEDFAFMNNIPSIDKIAKRIKHNIDSGIVSGTNSIDKNQFDNLYHKVTKDIKILKNITITSVLSSTDKKNSILNVLSMLDTQINKLNNYRTRSAKLESLESNLGKNLRSWIRAMDSGISNKMNSFDQKSHLLSYGQIALLGLLALAFFFGVFIYSKEKKLTEKRIESTMIDSFDDILTSPISNLKNGFSPTFYQKMDQFRKQIQVDNAFSESFQKSLPYPAIMLNSSLEFEWANSDFFETLDLNDYKDETESLNWNLLLDYINLDQTDDDPVTCAMEGPGSKIHSVQVQTAKGPSNLHVAKISKHDKSKIVAIFTPVEVKEVIKTVNTVEKIVEQDESLIAQNSQYESLIEKQNEKIELQQQTIRQFKANLQRPDDGVEVLKLEIDQYLDRIEAIDHELEEYRNTTTIQAREIQELVNSVIHKESECDNQYEKIATLGCQAQQQKNVIGQQATQIQELNCVIEEKKKEIDHIRVEVFPQKIKSLAMPVSRALDSINTKTFSTSFESELKEQLREAGTLDIFDKLQELNRSVSNREGELQQEINYLENNIIPEKNKISETLKFTVDQLENTIALKKADAENKLLEKDGEINNLTHKVQQLENETIPGFAETEQKLRKEIKHIRMDILPGTKHKENELNRIIDHLQNQVIFEKNKECEELKDKIRHYEFEVIPQKNDTCTQLTEKIKHLENEVLPLRDEAEKEYESKVAYLENDVIQKHQINEANLKERIGQYESEIIPQKDGLNNELKRKIDYLEDEVIPQKNKTQAELSQKIEYLQDEVIPKKVQDYAELQQILNHYENEILPTTLKTQTQLTEQIEQYKNEIVPERIRSEAKLKQQINYLENELIPLKLKSVAQLTQKIVHLESQTIPENFKIINEVKQTNQHLEDEIIPEKNRRIEELSQRVEHLESNVIPDYIKAKTGLEQRISHLEDVTIPELTQIENGLKLQIAHFKNEIVPKHHETETKLTAQIEDYKDSVIPGHITAIKELESKNQHLENETIPMLRESEKELKLQIAHFKNETVPKHHETETKLKTEIEDYKDSVIPGHITTIKELESKNQHLENETIPMLRESEKELKLQIAHFKNETIPKHHETETKLKTEIEDYKDSVIPGHITAIKELESKTQHLENDTIPMLRESEKELKLQIAHFKNETIPKHHETQDKLKAHIEDLENNVILGHFLTIKDQESKNDHLENVIIPKLTINEFELKMEIEHFKNEVIPELHETKNSLIAQIEHLESRVIPGHIDSIAELSSKNEHLEDVIIPKLTENENELKLQIKQLTNEEIPKLRRSESKLRAQISDFENRVIPGHTATLEYLESKIEHMENKLVPQSIKNAIEPISNALDAMNSRTFTSHFRNNLFPKFQSHNMGYLFEKLTKLDEHNSNQKNQLGQVIEQLKNETIPQKDEAIATLKDKIKYYELEVLPSEIEGQIKHEQRIELLENEILPEKDGKIQELASKLNYFETKVIPQKDDTIAGLELSIGRLENETVPEKVKEIVDLKEHLHHLNESVIPSNTKTILNLENECQYLKNKAIPNTKKSIITPVSIVLEAMCENNFSNKLVESVKNDFKDAQIDDLLNKFSNIHNTQTQKNHSLMNEIEKLENELCQKYQYINNLQQILGQKSELNAAAVEKLDETKEIIASSVKIRENMKQSFENTLNIVDDVLNDESILIREFKDVTYMLEQNASTIEDMIQARDGFNQIKEEIKNYKQKLVTACDNILDRRNLSDDEYRSMEQALNLVLVEVKGVSSTLSIFSKMVNHLEVLLDRLDVIAGKSKVVDLDFIQKQKNSYHESIQKESTHLNQFSGASKDEEIKTVSGLSNVTQMLKEGKKILAHADWLIYKYDSLSKARNSDKLEDNNSRSIDIEV